MTPVPGRMASPSCASRTAPMRVSRRSSAGARQARSAGCPRISSPSPRSGSSVTIGRWVLEAACHEARTGQLASRPDADATARPAGDEANGHRRSLLPWPFGPSRGPSGRRRPPSGWWPQLRCPDRPLSGTHRVTPAQRDAQGQPRSAGRTGSTPLSGPHRATPGQRAAGQPRAPDQRRSELRAGACRSRIDQDAPLEYEHRHVVLVEASRPDPDDALAGARLRGPDLQHL